MPPANGRAWKLGRAGVPIEGKSRPRSDKYSHSGSHERPAPGERVKCWVGGYARADGVAVTGHYRKIG